MTDADVKAMSTGELWNEVERLRERVAELERERDEIARVLMEGVSSAACTGCGLVIGKDRADWQAEMLAHVMACPKHPVSVEIASLRAEIDRLTACRAADVALLTAARKENAGLRTQMAETLALLTDPRFDDAEAGQFARDTLRAVLSVGGGT